MKNKKYVVGLVFDNTKRVMLIKKNRPDWQNGYFNGVGGEIKQNEKPIDAIKRECKEESNLYINNWTEYKKTIFDNGVVLYYYCSLITEKKLNEFKSKTDEIISIFNSNNIPENTHKDIKDFIKDFISRYEYKINEQKHT